MPKGKRAFGTSGATMVTSDEYHLKAVKTAIIDTYIPDEETHLR